MFSAFVNISECCHSGQRAALGGPKAQIIWAEAEESRFVFFRTDPSA
ncbi:MAG: hypothetical protein UT31_C0002G0014 [Parcubacteria group bacterium GW2011_GWF2_39_13b]|nr:MAG: hypothetical protein UT31_C0002G0014 [Parcubacteria group bacterium GW2011_GWF2_39_13b]